MSRGRWRCSTDELKARFASFSLILSPMGCYLPHLFCSQHPFLAGFTIFFVRRLCSFLRATLYDSLSCCSQPSTKMKMALCTHFLSFFSTEVQPSRTARARTLLFARHGLVFYFAQTSLLAGWTCLWWEIRIRAQSGE